MYKTIKSINTSKRIPTKDTASYNECVVCNTSCKGGTTSYYKLRDCVHRVHTDCYRTIEPNHCSSPFPHIQSRFAKDGLDFCWRNNNICCSCFTEIGIHSRLVVQWVSADGIKQHSMHRRCYYIEKISKKIRCAQCGQALARLP